MTDGPRKTPATLKGVAYMVGSMAVLPYLDVTAKYLGQTGMPVMETVWARLFFGALLTLPFALRAGGVAALRPRDPAINLTRAALLMTATFCFFASLRWLSVADALAIFFVNPLIVTALSPALLGEKVDRRRWIAVAIGFIGTLIIIRPGFKEVNAGVVLALASGVCLAIYLLLSRKISGRTDPVIITFHTTLLGAALASVLVVAEWQWPSPWQWTLMLLVGVIATLGHFLILSAYRHAEASLLAPLAYLEMVNATLGGWLFFGDFPDLWTFVGVGVLVLCAVYISAGARRSQAPVTEDFEQP
jgi:drug/metabolite transporter (DMT)-like permease